MIGSKDFSLTTSNNLNNQDTIMSKTTTNRLIDKSNDKESWGSSFKRRYLTRLCWALSLILIILSFIFLKTIGALIISFTLLGLSSLINILVLYISPKKMDFSLDAYVSIIISYCLALITFIIVPLDISASLSNEADVNSNFNIHNNIDIVWKVVYWTSMLINFLMMRFQIAYWSQGHPTIRQRMTCTLKKFIKQIVIISLIGIAVLTFLLIKYMSLMKGIEIVISIIQVINLLYCLVHIIVLLGYGLVHLPFYFFTFTRTGAILKVSLKNLNETRNELEIGVNKLLKDKATLTELCNKYITKNAEIPKNKLDTLVFTRKIIAELGEYNFEINRLINVKKVDGNIKTPKSGYILNEVTDDVLAQMLIIVKEDYYYCCKKEATLLKTYLHINKNCEVVDESFGSSISVNMSSSVSDNKKRSSSIVMNKSSSFGTNNKIYCLIPKIYPVWVTVLTRLFSFVLLCISISFLVFQLNLPFLSFFNLIYTISTLILQSNFYLNYFFIIFYSSYFLVCCFYSLSNFKFFEIYILVPHHTNKFGMAFNSSMCNTLILGICYNILYFFSFIYDKKNMATGKTSSSSALNDFFNSMKKVEFVYGYYIYFFPILLFLVVFITLLRKFNILCFMIKSLNDFEVELNPVMLKSDEEIISEETFADEKDKIKFDVLEMIQDIYYNNESELEIDKSSKSIETV